MEAQTTTGSLFPPAPEDDRATTAAAPKKRAARKSAKKASAKKATKKVVAEQQPTLAIANEPAAAPAPVVEAPSAKEPQAEPARKATRTTAARKTARKTTTARGRKKASDDAETSSSESVAATTTVKADEVAQQPAPKAASPKPQPAPEVQQANTPAPASAPVPAAPATVPAVAATSTSAESQPQQSTSAPQSEQSITPPAAAGEAEGAAQSQTQSREQQQQPQNRDRNDRGGRFRNKWDKRNKRFRNRNRPGEPSAEGGQQTAPPPERPLGPPEPTEGLLELTPKGYGHLRQKSRQYASYNQDPWVSPEWIRSLGLREGMYIKGVQQEGHRGPQVTQILEVNGMEPDKVRDLPLFEELKAVNPNKRIQLETTPERLTTRVMDLITPLGRGQRGLIVAPPRAGKTTLLQHIAEAVTEKHQDLHLMIVLIDERPEEVTEFRRALPNAEIHASSNDSDVKSHIRTATLAIERAKRLVEAGRHVFMLLDSITRMGRAFNNAHKGGATMSGGVGVGALELPRRLFAAARNTRDAGSLTILATTLIETNSRMDELIFQEFKGTGNLELVLDRKIAEQYIYPAVNIFKSGTRREELLLPPFQMEKIHMLRRGLAGHKPIDAIQRVISLLERSPNNAQMLVELPSSK